jgi:hypothetical protein
MTKVKIAFHGYADAPKNYKANIMNFLTYPRNVLQDCQGTELKFPL